MFVHNLVDGELLAKEVEFLQSLQGHFSSEEQFIRNTVIALTNAHQLEDAVAESVQAQIEGQLAKSFTQPFTIFAVDSLSYLNAMKESKSLLAANSNVPALLEKLGEKAKFFAEHIEEERCNVLQAQKQQLLQQAEQLKVEKEAEFTKANALTINPKELDAVIQKIDKVIKEISGEANCEAFVEKNRGSAYAHLETISRMRHLTNTLHTVVLNQLD